MDLAFSSCSARSTTNTWLDAAWTYCARGKKYQIKKKLQKFVKYLNSNLIIKYLELKVKVKIMEGWIHSFIHSTTPDSCV